MSTKRGADFQAHKDDPFNANGSESSDQGSRPSRASSAQLAKRKIAQARRPAGGGGGAARQNNFAVSNNQSFSASGGGFGQSAPVAGNAGGLFGFGQPNGQGASNTNGFAATDSNMDGIAQPFGQGNQAANSSGSSFAFGSQNTFNFTPAKTVDFGFGSVGGASQGNGGYKGTLFNIPPNAAPEPVSTPFGTETDSRRSPSPSKGESRKKRFSGTGDSDTPLWAASSPFHSSSNTLQGSQEHASSITNGLSSHQNPARQPNGASSGSTNSNPFASTTPSNPFASTSQSTPLHANNQGNLFAPKSLNAGTSFNTFSATTNSNPFGASLGESRNTSNTTQAPVSQKPSLFSSQSQPSQFSQASASTSAPTHNIFGTASTSIASQQASDSLHTSTADSSSATFEAPKSQGFNFNTSGADSLQNTPTQNKTASGFTFTSQSNPAAPSSNIFSFGSNQPSPSQSLKAQSSTPSNANNPSLSREGEDSHGSAAPNLFGIKTPSTAPQSRTTSMPGTQFGTQSPATTKPADKVPASTFNLFGAKSSASETQPTPASLGSNIFSKPAAVPQPASNNMFALKENNIDDNPVSGPVSSSPRKTDNVNSAFNFQPPLAQASTNASLLGTSPLKASMASPFPASTNESSTRPKASEFKGYSAIDINVDVLRKIRAQCLTLLPSSVPEEFTDDEKDQYIYGYRLMCLEKGLLAFVDQLTGDEQEMRKVAAYYAAAKSFIFQAAGSKRKATNADLDENVSPNKRTNLNGPVHEGPGASKPLFNFPSTVSKNGGSLGLTDTTQTGGSVSILSSDKDTPKSSQTSQLFANLANSPSKMHGTSGSGTFGTVTQATTAQETSSSKPSMSFGGVPQPQSDTSSNSPFKFKAADSPFGTAQPLSKPTPSTNFLSQFKDSADKYEEERKAKAKDEEWDEDEETEAEWEKRWEERQLASKEQKSQKKLTGMPTFSIGSGTNFFDQFSKSATKNANDEAKEAMERRKLEDMDSDEDEAEWERKDAEKQRRLKEERETAARSAEGFKLKPSGDSPALSGTSAISVFSTDGPTSRTPTPNIFESLSHAGSDAEGSKIGDADNEESDEENDGHQSPETPEPPFTPGRSLFDRIQKDESNNTLKNASPNSSTPKANPFASSLFGSSGLSTTPSGDHTWKPESPIKFASGASAPSVNITSPSPSKTPAAETKSTSSFGSLFGSSQATSTTTASSNPFAHLSSTPSTGFNFSPQAKVTGNNLAPKSVLESANTSRGTSPGMTTADESTGEGREETPSDEPQLDFSEARAGEEDEEVLFAEKSKGLELDSPAPGEAKQWNTRGVGELRLLQNRETRKCRMVLRAGPASKVVLNTGLQPTINYSLEGAKGVKFFAPKTGGLTNWTLRFGKSEDAARLCELLEEHKKN